VESRGAARWLLTFRPLASKVESTNDAYERQEISADLLPRARTRSSRQEERGEEATAAAATTIKCGREEEEEEPSRLSSLTAFFVLTARLLFCLPAPFLRTPSLPHPSPPAHARWRRLQRTTCLTIVGASAQGSTQRSGSLLEAAATKTTGSSPLVLLLPSVPSSSLLWELRAAAVARRTLPRRRTCTRPKKRGFDGFLSADQPGYNFAPLNFPARLFRYRDRDSRIAGDPRRQQGRVENKSDIFGNLSWWW
jgi:hypothetical protein